MPNERAWTPSEDALLGTDLDLAVAKRIQRTKNEVTVRRNRLNIPATCRPPYSSKINWGATELAMLGHYPDAELAKLIGRTIADVQAKRLELQNGHR
jgi:hypothetical protein